MAIYSRLKFRFQTFFFMVISFSLDPTLLPGVSHPKRQTVHKSDNEERAGRVEWVEKSVRGDLWHKDSGKSEREGWDLLWCMIWTQWLWQKDRRPSCRCRNLHWEWPGLKISISERQFRFSAKLERQGWRFGRVQRGSEYIAQKMLKIELPHRPQRRFMDMQWRRNWRGLVWLRRMLERVGEMETDYLL